MSCGLGYSPRIARRPGRDVSFCSMNHMRLWECKIMVDWTPQESEMVLAAGKAGGEYLDEIGITDLRRLSKPQWEQFLRCVIGRWAEIRPGYLEQWRKMCDQELKTKDAG